MDCRRPHRSIRLYVDIPGGEGAAAVAVCKAIIKSAESGNAEVVEYLK